MNYREISQYMDEYMTRKWGIDVRKLDETILIISTEPII